MIKRTAIVMALLVGFGLSAAPLSAQESSRGGLTLAAPFERSGEVDRDFVEEISERLHRQVQNIDRLTAVSTDEVEGVIDRFNLDRKRMDRVDWQQVAQRLDVRLLIHGTVSRQQGQVRIEARFHDVPNQTTTSLEPITVAEDGERQARQVAQIIGSQLREHVDLLVAVLNCQDYLNSEQWADAERNCQQALELDSTNLQALELMGRIHTQREEWESARKMLAPVVEQRPEDAQALQSLGYVHAQLGNTDQAVRLYRRYLQLNPGDQEVRLSVAYQLASTGGYTQALDMLEAGLASDSTQAPLWKYIGDIAIQKGTRASARQMSGQATITDTASIQKALRAYERYLEYTDQPPSATLYRNMIAAHMQLGDFPRAQDLTTRALEAYPEEIQLYDLAARLYARQQNLARAREMLTQALARDSTYTDGFFRRGLYALRQDNFEPAIQDFRRATQLGGDQTQMADQLFSRAYQQYFQQGQLTRARRIFQAAREFAPTGSDNAHRLNFFIGYSHYKQAVALDEQNTEEACEPARRALERFRQVRSWLDRAGDYQAQSQAQIQDRAEKYQYRQNQIIKRACRD